MYDVWLGPCVYIIFKHSLQYITNSISRFLCNEYLTYTILICQNIETLTYTHRIFSPVLCRNMFIKIQNKTFHIPKIYIKLNGILRTICWFQFWNRTMKFQLCNEVS